MGNAEIKAAFFGTNDELKLQILEYQARIKQLEAQNDALREALRELHALVEGECPRLLDMDSDGYWELEQRICAALEET